MGLLKASVNGLLFHLLVVLRLLCCVCGLFIVVLRSRLTINYLLHGEAIYIQHAAFTIGHVLELMVCIGVTWKCVRGTHATTRLWPMYLQSLLLCVSFNLQYDIDALDTHDEGAEKQMVTNILCYSPLLLFAALFVMFPLESLLLRSAQGSIQREDSHTEQTSPDLTVKEKVIKACTLLCLSYILCVQSVELFRVETSSAHESKWRNVYPIWRNVLTLVVHIVFTLQTAVILIIQLYRSSSCHIPVYSKVIIVYLTVHVMSNAGLASMDSGVIIAVSIVGAAFLVFLPISRLAIIPTHNIADYFKLHEIKRRVGEYSGCKRAVLLRVSCLSAVIGLALSMLAAILPWFEVVFTPTEELLRLNHTLHQLDRTVSTVVKQVQALLDSFAEVKGLGTCETVVTASVVAIIFPAFRSVLQDTRKFMYLNRIAVGVNKYRDRLVMMREAANNIRNLMSDIQRPLTLGVSGYNIGFVMFLLPALLTCVGIVCVGLWPRLYRSAPLPALMIGGGTMLLLNIGCAVLLFAWPYLLVSMLDGLPVLRASVSWASGCPMLLATMITSTFALVCFMWVLVIWKQDSSSHENVASAGGRCSSIETTGERYDSSRLSSLLFGCLVTFVALGLAITSSFTPWLSVAPLIKPHWLQAVTTLKHELNSSQLMYDDLLSARFCGLEVTAVPDFQSYFSTFFNDEFLGILQELSSALNLPHWDLLEVNFDPNIGIVLLPLRILLTFPALACLGLLLFGMFWHSGRMYLSTVSTILGKITVMSGIQLFHIYILLQGALSHNTHIPLFDVIVRFHNGLLFAAGSTAVLGGVWLFLKIEHLMPFDQKNNTQTLDNEG